jgi:hypothetical protein
MLGAKTIDMANDILQKPSLNLKKTLHNPKKQITSSKIAKLCKLKKSLKLSVRDDNTKDISNHNYNNSNTSAYGKYKKMLILLWMLN